MDQIWEIKHGIVVNGKITPDKFISISVPDKFELFQIYAMERGKNIGDRISSYSTELIEGEVQNPSSLSIVNKKNNILNRIWNKIKRKESEIQPTFTDNIDTRRSY